ncbi:MAG: DUF1648 domain-containing protein [Treponema sp.]|nr:DUF1648 domain-containing protein [Treponema sp.]
MADVNILLFIFNIFVFVLCGVLYMIMPQLTRKSFLFGVKIPPEQANCPEARSMKKRYTLTCLSGTFFMLIVCIVQFIVRREITILASMYLPFLIILIGLAAFIPNWKQAVSLKEKRGWQVSNALFAETGSSYTRGNLSALPWIWYIAGFVLVIAAFAIAIVRYPALPEMIAGHMDANLRPTRWVEKTWLNVLTMPIINTAILAVMILTAILIEKARLQIDPDKPRLSFAQHRIYRWRFGHALGFLSLILVLFIIIAGLPILFPDSPVWNAKIFWGNMALLLIPIVVIIAVMVKTGQGGCKVKIETEGNNTGDQKPVPVHSSLSGNNNSGKISGGKFGDDKYWILGLVYCNPDDPAYIVENRFGAKLGFNYARLPVKTGMAILLLGLIAVYVWLTMLVL